MIKKWSIRYPAVGGEEERRAYVYLPTMYEADELAIVAIASPQEDTKSENLLPVAPAQVRSQAPLPISHGATTT